MDNNFLCLLASGILAVSLLYTKSDKKKPIKSHKHNNRILHSQLDNILDNLDTNSFNSDLEFQKKQKNNKTNKQSHKPINNSNNNKLNQNHSQQIIHPIDTTHTTDTTDTTHTTHTTHTTDTTDTTDTTETTENISKTNNDSLEIKQDIHQNKKPDLFTGLIDTLNKTTHHQINLEQEKQQFKEHTEILEINYQINKNIDYIVNNSHFDILTIINNLGNDLYNARNLYELNLILDITNEIIKLISNINNHNTDHKEDDKEDDLEPNNDLVNRTFYK